MTGSRVALGYLFCLALLTLELAVAALLARPPLGLLDVAALFSIAAVLLAPVAVIAGIVVEAVIAPRLKASPGPRALRSRRVVVAAVCGPVAIGSLLAASQLSGEGERLASVVVALSFAAGLALGDGDAVSAATLAQARQRAFLRGASALAIFAGATLLLPRSLSHVRGVPALASLTGAPIAGEALAAALALDPGGIEPPAPSAPPVPERPFDARGWDVLLVTVGSLRADHVGVYGYDRATSPNIDRLAREGVLFENAYSPSPVTSYAIASLFTGKYMRPLLEMELGADSSTWAELLHAQGYRTAAFFPSSIFGADEPKVAPLRDRKLGFDVAYETDVPGRERPQQVASYLAGIDRATPVFAWVHLAEPNEPYEQQGESFGSRDIDRYDSEIADADATIALLVKVVRERKPKTLVIISGDHGEEFGEHGGRYHGTSVYEEQVHVPLVIHAPELFGPRRIKGTVATIDLMPTSVAAVGAPPPPRVRGRDLGSVIAGSSSEPFAPAHAETDEMSLFAEGQLRLVCLRRVGACSLYDLDQDPRQRRDIAASRPRELSILRASMRELEGRVAKREREGRESVPDALPEPLRRALAGDADAAIDIGALLAEKEVTIRRKAAVALFELGSKDATPALRAALTREQDPETKAYIALALVRLGEGAPYVFELYDGPDLGLRRLAALALAESGDFRGQNVLLAWWRAAFPDTRAALPEDAMSHARARQVLSAFALRKSKDSVGFLMVGLRDEKLRPYVARALAKIGEDAARPAIAEWLYSEPRLNTRIAMIAALLELGGGPELRDPLVSFLGMPEPLPNGVDAAIRGDIVEHIGGPARDAERNRLRRFAQSGVLVDFIVPDLTKGAQAPAEGPRVRVICRAESSTAGEIRVGARGDIPKSSEKKAPIPANRPALDGSRSAILKVPEGEGPVEVFADLPDEAGARPGKQASLVFFATQGVRIEACVLVPRRTDPPREKN